MTIQIFKTQAELNDAFTERLKEIIATKETITVALSGGSTPKSLFDHWAKLPEDEIDWKKIRFFWGDERCVPPTDDESNYKMTKEHFFDFVQAPAANIFRIKGENDPEMEAKRYGTLLQSELGNISSVHIPKDKIFNSETEEEKGNLQSEKGETIPSFDLLMLGMGDDGHTASIFPHEISHWDSPGNCITATHPISGQKRVSLTGKVINAAKNVFFLVTGENKAEKVKEIIEQPLTASKKYPAALVQPTTGNLSWFLDEAASRLLY